MYGYDGNRSRSRTISPIYTKKKSKKQMLSNFWFWLPKQDYAIFTLLREWSLHGVKYLAQVDRHILERFVWLVTILTSMGAAAFLSYEVVSKYNQSPVIVSFQSSHTTVSQVPFPAVTVCNVNRFRKSYFEMAMKNVYDYEKNPTADGEKLAYEAFRVLEQMDHLCETSKNFCNAFNYSVNETTVNLAHRGFKFKTDDFNMDNVKQADSKHAFIKSLQSCEEMILLCLWEGEKMDCSKLFSPIITDFGVCCVFNMIPRRVLSNLTDMKFMSIHEIIMPDEELEAWKNFNLDNSILSSDPFFASLFPRNQSKAGQASGLSILLDPELNEYYCTSHCGYGFRILPHSPIEFPLMSDFGMPVGPKTEVFINVQADVTLADKDIKDLDYTTRYCYYLHEHPLENYVQYTSANCIQECILNITNNICKCVPLDLPQTQNNRTICTRDKLNCYNDILREVSINGSKNSCKQCLPSCNRIQYTSQASTLTARDDVDLWFKDGKSAKWASKNLSIVHIFFGSDTVISRVRKRLYGYTELFANIGGVLGILTGFSVLSLVELIYFLIRSQLWPGEPSNDEGESIKRKTMQKPTDIYYKKAKIVYPGGFPFLN